MNVEVDKDLCCGHGICLILAPNVFEMGDDDRAAVVRPELDGTDSAAALDAVSECPARAIRTVDE